MKNNKSPIYYANITGHIKHVKSKAVVIVLVKGLVVKGTPEQIKTREVTKRNFLKRYLGTSKKAFAFDIDRLIIVNVEILTNLGYGTPV